MSFLRASTSIHFVTNQKSSFMIPLEKVWYLNDNALIDGNLSQCVEENSFIFLYIYFLDYKNWSFRWPEMHTPMICIWICWQKNSLRKWFNVCIFILIDHQEANITIHDITLLLFIVVANINIELSQRDVKEDRKTRKEIKKKKNRMKNKDGRVAIASSWTATNKTKNVV